MFYLHISNRTENLLTQLAEVMRVDRQADIFAREIFLIQSQGMERMVAQTMADEFRSFCNFKFFLPLDFLNYIAGQLGIEINSASFTRENLCWRLEGLLRDVSKELYGPLRNYLQGAKLDLKRYQLAARLAYVFDQYQIMRPEMLESWGKGTLVTKNEAEPWQMDLWTRLLEQVDGAYPRGTLFRQVTDCLRLKNLEKSALPKRISVVGVHILPPIYLDFLNILAESIDVHFLLLSPCRDYWDGSDSRKNILQNKTVSQQDGSAEEIHDHHPLLRNLGRQGRDLQDMMLERTAVTAEFTSYEDPVAGNLQTNNASLLTRLQGDLLNGSSPVMEQGLDGNDDSIKIVSCHSKQRELMVLKDNLLHLLHTNKALELRDIVVMAPDIQQYSGLIPAFFSDLQHSIADRSLCRRNSTIQAFVSFLNLIDGRFGWNEVLDLLRQPAVFPQFGLSPNDLEKVQDWVIGAGIRWGLSGNHRQLTGAADIDETSWNAGIERLLMGYAIDSDNFVDGVLPYTELEGQGAQPLGGLCEYVGILDHAEQQFKKRYTMAEWVILLQKYVQKLFGEGAENDLGELRGLIGELSDFSAYSSSHLLSFEVIREWFEKSTAESRSSSGFLRGQLTFCSMLPMRSIPFKVVCLLGLNDGVFPSNDIHDTFDLIADSYRLGDRSPRADDRYQFLEAILSARSNLYLSYIGQSIKTNKEVPPSVVVTELLDLLENYYGIKNCVVKHPLHPFSAAYFDGMNPRLFSYDSYYYETAEILQQNVIEEANWLQEKLKPVGDVIELRDLFNFYKNPQKYFVRNCLGINLGLDYGLPDENELFEIQGLEKYEVEQELLGSMALPDLKEMAPKLQNCGEWILGNPGLLLMEKYQAGIRDFSQQVDLQNAGAPVEDLEIDLKIGNYRLIGRLQGCHERGVVILRYGKLRGADLLRGWLVHQLVQSVENEKWTRIVSKDQVISFTNSIMEPSLETLIDIYVGGCQVPSRLFIEPSYAYLQQYLKDKDGVKSLLQARKKYQFYMLEGYEPEWQMLFGETDAEELLAENFEELTELVMQRIWSNSHE